MNRITALLIFFGILIITFLGWFVRDELTTLSEPPVFRMTRQNVYGRSLLIRRESPNGNLLLKVLNEPIYSRYDLQMKTASEAKEQDWNNATEKITVCYEKFTLLENGTIRKYGSYGKYTLGAGNSPDGANIAVVSAYGPKGPSISVIPFLGGGGKIFGQRYIEVKENLDGYKTIGKPFRINRIVMPDPTVCWSEDQNLLVVYDGSDFYVSVINLNPQAKIETELPKAAKNLSSKPDLSRITKIVRDYGVDENGDGLFEKVAVEVETETSVAGRYKIFMGLTAANGKRFITSTETNLNGGIEVTKVLFDAKTWFDEKVNGSLKIDNLQLDYGDSLTIEQRNDLGQTVEYRTSQFTRLNIIYTGENQVTPTDNNQDKKYEKLSIEVGVDVFLADNYEFQGTLYNEVATEIAQGRIETVSGKAELKKGKGKIIFFFSGKEIIKYGVSGKFQLRNVVIYKEGQSGELKRNVLYTKPFDVNQFESED